MERGASSLEPGAHLVVVHEVIGPQAVPFLDEDDAPANVQAAFPSVWSQFAEAKASLPVRLSKMPGDFRQHRDIGDCRRADAGLAYGCAGAVR